MVTIGVDPGKSTGVAICINGEIADIMTTDFWGAIGVISDNDGAIVVLELPTTKAVWHNGAKAKKAIQRTGVNVGGCLREAELIRDYLVQNKVRHITTRPLGKLDSNAVKKITGFTGRTNQHTRDAIMLSLVDARMAK